MLTGNALTWIKSRAISAETSAQFPVANGTTFFPDLSRKSEAVFFKYAQGWKARSFPDKAFVSGGDFKPSLWNLEAVLAADPSTVMITEGEIDALSIGESGIPAYQILSVPTGAGGLAHASNGNGAIHHFGNGKTNGHAFMPDWALSALKAGLNKVKRIVWCGDADAPGQSLRHKMMEVFGVARFMTVEWPENINDPNAMLMSHGANHLRNIVLNAKLAPQDGLFRLSELPSPLPLTLWEPSLPGFGGRIRLAPRTLSVVTGQPGHGKTTFFGELWFDLAKKYDFVVTVASFETRPKPHLRRQLRTLLTGKLEIELSDAEMAQADAWIEDHYLFLQHHDQRPTLDWLLDCAETAVIRHGAKVVQIDPWNRLEAMRDRNESETDYILRCLRAMYVFATDMDCHVQVLAHPAKMDTHRRGQAPTLEDINGSKAWENVVDQGFTVHRPRLFEGKQQITEASIYHRKARFLEELGFPCKIDLLYDLTTRRYVPLLQESE